MKLLPIENAYSYDIILFDIVPALRIHKENIKYSLLNSPKQKNALVYFHSCQVLCQDLIFNSFQGLSWGLFLPMDCVWKLCVSSLRMSF